jgi:hypothetical protein
VICSRSLRTELSIARIFRPSVTSRARASHKSPTSRARARMLRTVLQPPFMLTTRALRLGMGHLRPARTPMHSLHTWLPHRRAPRRIQTERHRLSRMRRGWARRTRSCRQTMLPELTCSAAASRAIRSSMPPVEPSCGRNRHMPPRPGRWTRRGRYIDIRCLRKAVPTSWYGPSRAVAQ